MLEPPPGAPLPPPPEDHDGRRAFLRVLLVTAAIPVLFAVGARLPASEQEPVMTVGMILVVLVPALAVMVGLLTYMQGERQAGVGYGLGGCVAAIIGFGACVSALAGSL